MREIQKWQRNLPEKREEEKSTRHNLYRDGDGGVRDRESRRSVRISSLLLFLRVFRLIVYISTSNIRRSNFSRTTKMGEIRADNLLAIISILFVPFFSDGPLFTDNTSVMSLFMAE